MQVLCSLENHAGKKINLFSSHRSNERCENCWFVRKCKERRHRIKKLNLPSRLTFTLKVKPRTNKSHQTIFATRQKKALPLFKKKKKKKQEERRKIKAIFIRKEIHKELGVCNFFTHYKWQSSIHFRVVSSMVSQEQREEGRKRRSIRGHNA